MISYKKRPKFKKSISKYLLDHCWMPNTSQEIKETAVFYGLCLLIRALDINWTVMDAKEENLVGWYIRSLTEATQIWWKSLLVVVIFKR